MRWYVIFSFHSIFNDLLLVPFSCKLKFKILWSWFSRFFSIRLWTAFHDLSSLSPNLCNTQESYKIILLPSNKHCMSPALFCNWILSLLSFHISSSRLTSPVFFHMKIYPRWIVATISFIPTACWALVSAFSHSHLITVPNLLIRDLRL